MCVRVCFVLRVKFSKPEKKKSYLLYRVEQFEIRSILNLCILVIIIVFMLHMEVIPSYLALVSHWATRKSI